MRIFHSAERLTSGRDHPVCALRIACLVLLAGSALGSGCWTGSYLAEQGAGQLRMLHARRRVVDVLADPEVAPDTKARLRLAMEARAFGVEVLGLRGGDNYVRFLDLQGRPLAWNVTAAPKDALRPHLYRFPLVGRIPYLGFFKEASARREQARLAAMDLDTYLRPVAGYSTLGITSDPIYSSMLESDEARIVEVVLHEMLHGTLYLAGRSGWNESLATFVGVRGAAAFFAARDGERAGARVLELAARRQRDQARFAAFLEPFVRELEALYRGPRSRADKLSLREAIFRRAQAEYLRLFPPPPGRRPGAFAARPLNNAVLLSYAVYHRDTPEHDRLYRRLGRDLRAFIRLYKHAVEDKDDPIAWLGGL